MCTCVLGGRAARESSQASLSRSQSGGRGSRWTCRESYRRQSCGGGYDLVEAPCRGGCTYGSDAARQLCWSLCGHIKRGSGWRMAIGSSRMFVVAPRRKILLVKLRVCRPLPGTRESVHSSTMESRRGEKERSGRCSANWQNRKSAEYVLSSCAKVQCGGIESERKQRQ